MCLSIITDHQFLQLSLYMNGLTNSRGCMAYIVTFKEKEGRSWKILEAEGGGRSFTVHCTDTCSVLVLE